MRRLGGDARRRFLRLLRLRWKWGRVRMCVGSRCRPVVSVASVSWKAEGRSGADPDTLAPNLLLSVDVHPTCLI